MTQSQPRIVNNLYGPIRLDHLEGSHSAPRILTRTYYKIFRIAWINNFTMIFAIVNRYMLIFKIECDWLVHLVLIIYSGSGILHLIVFNCNYRNMTYINNMEALV